MSRWGRKGELGQGEKRHRPTCIYYTAVTQPHWTWGVTMAPWDPHGTLPSHIHCMGKNSGTCNPSVSSFLKAPLSWSALSLHLALSFSTILRLTVLQPKGWDIRSYLQLSVQTGKNSVKRRERESWPGHTVNWGREPATRVIAVVADLSAQGIHLWLTICLGSCKHQQNTMFFSSYAILSLLLPPMPSTPGHKQGMQHLRAKQK